MGQVLSDISQSQHCEREPREEGPGTVMGLQSPCTPRAIPGSCPVSSSLGACTGLKGGLQPRAGGHPARLPAGTGLEHLPSVFVPWTPGVEARPALRSLQVPSRSVEDTPSPSYVAPFLYRFSLGGLPGSVRRMQAMLTCKCFAQGTSVPLCKRFFHPIPISCSQSCFLYVLSQCGDSCVRGMYDAC